MQKNLVSRVLDYSITEKTINIQTYFCTQSKDKEKYSEIFTEGSYKLKKNE